MADFTIRVVNWLRRDHGTPEGRAAYAEVKIEATGVCLTEVADNAASSVRRTIRVSAAALAGWLLHNRWRILYEPTGSRSIDWAMSHQLSGVGGGFCWPDVTLSSDGERLRIVARRTGASADPVRFLNDHAVEVPSAAFDLAVDPFVQRVVDRLLAQGLHDSPLVALSEDVRADRADPETDALRVAEARLGLDPDVEDADVIRAVRERIAWAGTSASAEILCALRFEDAAQTLDWVRERKTHPDVEVDLSAFASFAEVPSPGAFPWARGVELARRLRTHLGLGLDPVDLDELLSAKLTAAEVERGRPLGVAIAARQPLRAGLTLTHHRSTGRRFEAARLIGDWLTKPADEVVLPLTNMKTARQKAQRAFAAEFLGPVDGLVDRVSLPYPRDEELEEAADHYGISPWAVRSSLVNHNRVDRSYLPRG